MWSIPSCWRTLSINLFLNSVPLSEAWPHVNGQVIIDEDMVNGICFLVRVWEGFWPSS